MKKLFAAALLSLAAFTFIAGAMSVSTTAAYARGAADDGAGHDKGDDRGRGGHGRDDAAGHR